MAFLGEREIQIRRSKACLSGWALFVQQLAGEAREAERSGVCLLNEHEEKGCAMVERILTLRELNRATLARQLLLERANLSALEAVKQLAGLQGQLSNPPYIGLWSRIHAFQREELTRLLEQRHVVRTSMMRRTLHLATAEDYLRFRPALRSLHPRDLAASFDTSGMSHQECAHVIADLGAYVRERPRTNRDLRAKLVELVPGSDERLLYKVRGYFSLIQVFPGGVWGVGGSPAYAEAELWLGRPFVTEAEGLRSLILSYLIAFGPASVKDLQTWSGLRRLQPVVHALRDELVTFRDEQGQELFDVPGAPLPAVDTPAPVRFLPDFDNLLLAQHDRRRIIADNYRSCVFPGHSMVLPTFLVDGFVRGVWKIERTRERATLVIQPFEPPGDTARKELQEEGERLMCWGVETIPTWEVVFAAYNGKGLGQNMWGRL